MGRAPRGRRQAGRGSTKSSLEVGLAEYLAQLAGGIPMGQNEIFRPHELGMQEAVARAGGAIPRCRPLRAAGRSPQARKELIDRLRAGEHLTETALDDELDMIRDQFRRFTAQEVTPHAHRWHLADELIPDALVAQLARAGRVRHLHSRRIRRHGPGQARHVHRDRRTQPRLDRRGLAGHALGNRGRPDRLGGHSRSRRRSGCRRSLPARCCPRPCSPNPTRARTWPRCARGPTQASDGSWRIDGNKTWITHAARSDLMTLLARSEPGVDGYGGLTMFLAPKPRGTDATNRSRPPA